MHKKVFITGITGFLGARLANAFLSKGYKVAGLRRNNSDLSRLSEIENRIAFINIESDHWREQVIDSAPSFIIHSAWNGVSAKDRNNWQVQCKNLDLLVELLSLSKTIGVKKFVAFGSQAEYGLFSGIISEDSELKPTTAYGFFKAKAMDILKFFCETEDMNWYWLRLFSFYGEGEDENWFIPSVVNSLMNHKPLEMTKGEQKYAYMYVGDLSEVISKIIESPVISGVYNVSSKTAYPLKEVVERLVEIVGNDNAEIKFGAIPYRNNQPMHIQGDVSKLESQIGFIHETSLDSNLQKVVRCIKTQTSKV